MDYKWVRNHNNRNKLKSEGNCDFLYIFFSWIKELFIKTRQVKSTKQDGCYKDITYVLGKRKYIRSNPIATKYIMPLWSTFPPLSPFYFDSSTFVFTLHMSNHKYRCLVSKHKMVLKFDSLKCYTCLLQLQYIQCNMCILQIRNIVKCFCYALLISTQEGYKCIS